jgi:ribosomal protein L7Ae-like RNA K-turn-binding protein
LRRNFRQNVTVESETLHSALCMAARRRVLGLIAAALRAGKLAIGATPVAKVLEAKKVFLVIVAADARAAAEVEGLPAAVAAGGAVAFGSKDELGSAVGRQQVGIVAVTDAGLARAMSRAVIISQMPPPRAERNRERERKDQRVDE